MKQSTDTMRNIRGGQHKPSTGLLEQFTRFFADMLSKSGEAWKGSPHAEGKRGYFGKAIARRRMRNKLARRSRRINQLRG